MLCGKLCAWVFCTGCDTAIVPWVLAGHPPLSFRPVLATPVSCIALQNSTLVSLSFCAIDLCIQALWKQCKHVNRKCFENLIKNVWLCPLLWVPSWKCICRCTKTIQDTSCVLWGGIYLSQLTSVSDGNGRCIMNSTKLPAQSHSGIPPIAFSTQPFQPKLKVCHGSFIKHSKSGQADLLVFNQHGLTFCSDPQQLPSDIHIRPMPRAILRM